MNERKSTYESITADIKHQMMEAWKRVKTTI